MAKTRRAKRGNRVFMMRVADTTSDLRSAFLQWFTKTNIKSCV
jgi:hypothetical protein